MVCSRVILRLIFRDVPFTLDLQRCAVAGGIGETQTQQNRSGNGQRLNPCLTHCATVPAPGDPHHAQRVREICLYRRSRSCRFSGVLVNSCTARGASGPRGRSVDLAPGVVNHLRGFASTTLTRHSEYSHELICDARSHHEGALFTHGKRRMVTRAPDQRKKKPFWA